MRAIDAQLASLFTCSFVRVRRQQSHAKASEPGKWERASLRENQTEESETVR